MAIRWGTRRIKAVNDFCFFKPEEFDKVHVLAFYATGPQVGNHPRSP